LKENRALAKRNEDFFYVNRDHLTFNDRVALSDRVYKRWNSWDSMDSNHAPLIDSRLLVYHDQVRPEQVPVLDLGKLIKNKKHAQSDISTPSSKPSKDS